MELLKTIFADSWTLIIHQPLPFVVMLVGGFLAAKMFYNERMSVLKERLNVSNEKSERLKEIVEAMESGTGEPTLKKRTSMVAVNLLEDVAPIPHDSKTIIDSNATDTREDDQDYPWTQAEKAKLTSLRMNDIAGILEDFRRQGIDTSELEKVVGDAKHWNDLPANAKKLASRKLAHLIYQLSVAGARAKRLP